MAGFCCGTSVALL